MQNSATKPIGSVTLPALLCALAGSLLSIGLDTMGHYAFIGAAVTDFWEAEPYLLTESSPVPQEAHWIAAFVSSWAITVLTLGSAFAWRRALVGLMLISVLAAFSPVLMLWGVLWLPMVTVVAALWSWFCAIIYGAQHTMPCEFDQVEEVSEEVKVESVKMKVETIPFPTKKKKAK